MSSATFDFCLFYTILDPDDCCKSLVNNPVVMWIWMNMKYGVRRGQLGRYTPTGWTCVCLFIWGRQSKFRNLCPDRLRAGRHFPQAGCSLVGWDSPLPPLPPGSGMPYSRADTPSMLSQHFITSGLNSTALQTHTHVSTHTLQQQQSICNQAAGWKTLSVTHSGEWGKPERQDDAREKERGRRGDELHLLFLQQSSGLFHPKNDNHCSWRWIPQLKVHAIFVHLLEVAIWKFSRYKQLPAVTAYHLKCTKQTLLRLLLFVVFNGS